MKNSVLGLSAVCCLAAVAFLGGCNKNADKGECCGSCSDKATIKEGSEKPAAAATEKSCSEAKGSCSSTCQDKAAN